MSSVKIDFDVEGMTCASCQAHVQKAAQKVPGVKDAQVNLLTNTMVVTLDSSRDDMQNAQTTRDVIQNIEQAVDKAGYKAIPRNTVLEPQSLDAPTSSNSSNLQDVKAQDYAQGDRSQTHQFTTFQDPQINAQKELNEKKHQLIWSLIFGVPLFYLAMGPMLGWPELPGLDGMQHMMSAAIVQLMLATCVLMVNKSIFVRGIKSLVHGAPNMDALIAVGSGASYLYSLAGVLSMANALSMQDVELAHGIMMSQLYFDSAGTILVLICLGKYFEARAKGKTTSSISALLNLQPKTATRLVVEDTARPHKTTEEKIPTQNVQVGDILMVRAGESVPVDGSVIAGEALIDESALTGEAIPVTKIAGNHVVGATLVTRGWLQMKVEAVGSATALAQIIKMVQDATMSKAPIQRKADVIAGVFVPVVMGLAALTFLLWLIVFSPGNVATALNFAVSVLVISCPCALGLAVPTAIMVGTERASRFGIMVKDAATLEEAKRINCVLFDKTGTLTEGKPQVIEAIYANDKVKTEVLFAVNALEQKSVHPLAQALCSYTQEKLGNCLSSASNPNETHGNSKANDITDNLTDYQEIPGGGLSGFYKGKSIIIGNQRLMAEQNIDTHAWDDYAKELAKQGQTVLFVALNQHIAALFGTSDVLKVQAKSAIAELKKQGIRSVMLTGDQLQTANVVAKKLAVDDVVAGVLPNQKAQKIDELQQQGYTVAMVGDGINDAPALAQADIGIAVGAGTEVAISSANVVLMDSDPLDVVRTLDLSYATMRIIMQNLFWALIYNVICIPVAMGVFSGLGITLNPMIGAAAMGFSSVFVVTNALRLFNWSPQLAKEAHQEAAKTAVSSCKETVLADLALDDHTQKESVVNNLASTTKGIEDNHKIRTLDSRERKNSMNKTLSIDGMMCAHCAAHVTDALQQVPGVSLVKVSLEDKNAQVELSDDADISTIDKALTQAVVDAGYQVSAIQ